MIQTATSVVQQGGGTAVSMAREWLHILGPAISALAAVAIVFLTIVNNRRSTQFHKWTISQREPRPVYVRAMARTRQDEHRIGGVVQMTLFNPGDVPIFLLRGAALAGWGSHPMSMHPAGEGLYVLRTPAGEHEIYHDIPRLEARDLLLDMSIPLKLVGSAQGETKLSLVFSYISGRTVRQVVYRVIWNRSSGMLHLPDAANVGSRQQ